jgi:hypothetical protein
MTPQQIVGLAARLCAVWLALTALSYLMSAFSIAQSPQDIQSASEDFLKTAVLTRYFVMVALEFGCALLLWFFPMAIAHKLIPRTKFQDTLRLPARQAVAAACVVLGLVIVVLKALPPLSVYLARIGYLIATGEQLLTVMSASQHINGFAGLVQLAAGVYLIFKAQKLAAKFVPAPSDAGASLRIPEDAVDSEEK